MSVAGLTLTWEHEPFRPSPDQPSNWRLVWQEKQQVLARVYAQDTLGTYVLHYLNTEPAITQEYLTLDAAQAAGINHAGALETP